MATTTARLTFEQFQEQYGADNKTYEFWYGEAIPKGMATLVHGLLEGIVVRMLKQKGYIAASEVTLRIDPQGNPVPDVIAKRPPILKESYPTEAWDVAVEIVSPDEKFPHLKDKCRKYKAWGFKGVFVVDPSDCSLAEWRDGALYPVDVLAEIPAKDIWQELDRQYQP